MLRFTTLRRYVPFEIVDTGERSPDALIWVRCAECGQRASLPPGTDLEDVARLIERGEEEYAHVGTCPEPPAVVEPVKAPASRAPKRSRTKWRALMGEPKPAVT